jgi:DNA (cytosine-5)-methyltransferase 1
MHKVISLFTGAGGLDIGLEAAGFKTVVAVENNAFACNTLRLNRSWPVLEKDIHVLSSMQLAEAGSIKPGEADLLVGGPPCQPFSKSAYWVQGDTRRLDDPRADTLTAYLRVLRDLQPKVFLLENVFGITYKEKDEALVLLQRAVERINQDLGTSYSFSWKVLNCADYGVPQLRERFFLVGARDGQSFLFPEPTHLEASMPALLGASKDRWRNAWDALGDLEAPSEELQVTGRWAGLLPSIPEGQNYLYHTSKGGGRPRAYA